MIAVLAGAWWDCDGTSMVFVGVWWKSDICRGVLILRYFSVWAGYGTCRCVMGIRVGYDSKLIHELIRIG